MMALASGDADAAMTKAGQAERYLQQPTLTNLLAAQAAEMSGNTTRAEQIYKELIKDPKPDCGCPRDHETTPCDGRYGCGA